MAGIDDVDPIPSDVLSALNSSIEYKCLLEQINQPDVRSIMQISKFVFFSLLNLKQLLAINTTFSLSLKELEGHCASAFDSILCWPRTVRGTLASLPCLAEWQGVHYDVTSNTRFELNHRCDFNVLYVFVQLENATRFCHEDGNWDNYTNYDQCQHLTGASAVPEFEPGVELPTIVYYVGYSISLISLSLAVAVFVYFK